MGEVQHSLFLSTHHFSVGGRIGPPRTTGAGRFPLFSWHSLLPFKNQVPVGDPIWYDRPIFQRLDDLIPEILSDDKVCLVMPKLNEELSVEERLRDYRKLISFALEASGNALVALSVHPRDAPLQGHLTDGIQVFPSQSFFSEISGGHNKLSELRQASMLVTDYFGAHVFRSSFYFNKPVFLGGDSLFHRAIHPSIRPYLLDFVRMPADSKQRSKISALFLGAENWLDPASLNWLLFQPEMPRLEKVIHVAVYKHSRRFRVHTRRATAVALTGKLASWLEKTRRNRWESHFPPFIPKSNLQERI
jgi:hypothetical protein